MGVTATADYLRSLVMAHETVEARVASLRNACAGQECWLLSCGPGLKRFYAEQVPPGAVVIAVKQAIAVYPAATFHLLNYVNLVQYEYDHRRPITMGYLKRKDTEPELDIRLHFARHSQEGIATMGDFNSWAFDVTPSRAYGPGIVYEVGFPLVAHLGCARLVTVGFDCDHKDNRHFYESTGSAEHELKTIARDMPAWKAWLFTRGVEWEKR